MEDGKPSVPSSVETPAPLIEPQSAWNVRLGRRTGGLDLDVLVLQCRSKRSDGLENAPKYAFRDQKMIFFLGRGHCSLSRLLPNWEADTASPYAAPIYSGRRPLYSSVFGERLGPQIQMLQYIWPCFLLPTCSRPPFIFSTIGKRALSWYCCTILSTPQRCSDWSHFTINFGKKRIHLFDVRCYWASWLHCRRFNRLMPNNRPVEIQLSGMYRLVIFAVNLLV